MSNHKKERLKRVVFADDHTRISPRSIEDLYALENSQVYLLIAEVYNNTPLFRQFSISWQRRIRLVRKYSEESFIEDAVLSSWVEFFKRVLMPMEDHWQAEQLKLYAGRSARDVYYMSLLVTHPALKQYIRKEAIRGRDFNELTATVDEAREALRWCNIYERIRQNQFFDLYSTEYPGLTLSSCTYLQLKEIAGKLGVFERKVALIRQIMSIEGADSFLSHNYQDEYRGHHGLLHLSLRQLRTILEELKSMQYSGVFYDESGHLVAKASNSD